MSGTSVDSIDAALVQFDTAGSPSLVAGHRQAIPAGLRRQVLALFADQPVGPSVVGRLDVKLGRLFARAARAVLRKAGVRASTVTAIGCHGQTVHHAPTGTCPFTWQLGDANIVAERTGITTVADFRRRDVAAGGQGAPLAPAFHAEVLRSATQNRVVLNLGGIANVTVLRSGGTNNEATGFDTGPASCLLDGWTERHLGVPMDEGGRLARSGRLLETLLARLLADSYFLEAPPKSTGREHFNLCWLDRHLADLPPDVTPADVARTLCELTAVSIRDALARWAIGTSEVLVCGGGARNAFLMERLSSLLMPAAVYPTDDAGVDSAWMECIAFAWLARATMAGRAGNLPAVTGARRPVVLGAIHPGRVAATRRTGAAPSG